MKKGQTIIAIITISGTVLASIIGGYFTASKRVSGIEAKVDVIEEREKNHYIEIEKQLKKIDTNQNAMDKKLDTLLLNK